MFAMSMRAVLTHTLAHKIVLTCRNLFEKLKHTNKTFFRHSNVTVGI